MFSIVQDPSTIEASSSFNEAAPAPAAQHDSPVSPLRNSPVSWASHFWLVSHPALR